MTEITNVTGTAFVVAEYRDEENRAVEPLYRDNVVSLFLSPESRRAADRAAAGFPLVKELVKLRTRYLDDMLDKQIAAGCRQVVVLGAGLDTRAVRKSSADVTYFEIDDKATLELKRARLAEHGMLGDTHFIAGNYVNDGLISAAPDERLRSGAADLRDLGGQHDVPAARLRQGDPAPAQGQPEALQRVVRLLRHAP